MRTRRVRLAILALTAATCPAAVDANAPARVVYVVPVARGAIERSQSFEGTFRPWMSVDLQPKVGGFVSAMAVDRGDRVQAGQELAVIEVPDLEGDIRRSEAERDRDRIAVGQSRANYDLAHDVLERLLGVDRDHDRLIAQQELDEARQKDTAAMAAWKTAEAQAAVSEAALARLRIEDGYRHVTAPFAGVVVDRHADPGALVPGPAGGGRAPAMLTIADTGRLRLVFPVDEPSVPSVAVGMPVHIAIDAIASRRDGIVARTTRRIEDATRTMEVEVDVPNPDGAIVAGMYATVGLTVERHDRALTVPIAAVRRGRSASVMVVGGDGAVALREVRTGIEDPERIEVLAGLSEGERVVVGGATDLVPGQRVVAREPGAGERSGADARGGGS